ncbi:RNA polymerase sigma factor [Pseudoteredinibacter isoporae]|uniref:RNA polymerase sigma-70 factor (ECF subfamily) n=1 Tax=Pseudoteredinibacter isoporae TaxID=570281 RepID=A0A7X0JSM6_9GAMM|nr:RNA polymerase sigma factor [Pseudoteredinibacter isoporae]MBB6520660.1 RNA polymerase sigma-70 factor (ECF subfamily) [Pseudoteredinibacter isoporae]NHO86227.1 RNA polymerase sigma factor [Pseudoteredinibacter isoporae]NIB25322.1 RNA polymerase sigma factor [Pseudoteredinibacter isoporae]
MTAVAEAYAGEDPDSPLVDQAASGDSRAFKQLYERHYKRVYALCLRMTANPESAEECTQEAFIKAWRKLDTFNKQSRFSTWLHTLASRTTLDYLRKHKSWLKLVFSQEEESIPEAHGPSLEQDNIELSSLDKLLCRLPERARVVFTLHGVEGYRHVEIAEMLGISSGASRAQYHRARNLLQEWLDHEAE